jgi:ATP-dependent DNA helicase MPH1
MEASAGMCHKYLLELSAETEDESGKKKSSATSSLRKDKNFMSLLSELEVQKVRPGGYGMHPKMETLKLLLLQHFGARMDEGEGTRAMVFVTYRDCVDEIVHMLNEESPLLKVMRFIGQGMDKQGRKGFAQKEQLEVSLELYPWMNLYELRVRSSRSSRLVNSTCLSLLLSAKRVLTLVRST